MSRKMHSGAALWLAVLLGVSAACVAPDATPGAPAEDETGTTAQERASSTESTDEQSQAPADEEPVRPARAEPHLEDKAALAEELAPQGASAESAEQRLRVRTAHEEASFAKTWRDRAALAAEKLRATFPPRNEPVAWASVLIFPERESYESYAEQFAPENHHALGYFDPLRRELVMAESNNEEALFATLLHETTHLVLRDFLGHRHPPAWLDEGFATYYETGELIVDEETGEQEIRFGAIHDEFARLAGRHLAAHGPFELRRFATMGYESFVEVDSRTLRLHYAVSWSLIYYLLNGDRGRYRPALQLYLEEIARAPDARMRYTHAFELCFRPILYSFEVGWAHWLQRSVRGR